MPNLPTYVCLLTKRLDGEPVTDRPTAERILGRWAPVRSTARYADALRAALAIRDAGGWALAVEEAELHLYEPTAVPA